MISPSAAGWRIARCFQVRVLTRISLDLGVKGGRIEAVRLVGVF
jgi:hypothetical protein